MTKSPMTLRDLRRKIYVKAKAEPSWRFWGLYVHVCKQETLRTAYALAKANDGAPGIDGVTFESIEVAGVDGFLAQLRDELVTCRYRPLRNRRHAIPKDGGTKVRVLSIPAIRDRVVQERSSSFWNPSSRRTSNRARLAIAQSGRRMRR
jgi:RNA-directed DNA polymerase